MQFPTFGFSVRKHLILVLLVLTGITTLALAALIDMPLFYRYAALMALAFAQNVAFALVSRARNRDNDNYHLIAAIFSNGVWFLTFRFLIVTNNMTWDLFIPYTVGTVLGSLSGARVSMVIEKILGAKADSK